MLPSTGGIGTTLFYIGGGILVLAAVILLVTKRRMNANDESPRINPRQSAHR